MEAKKKFEISIDRVDKIPVPLLVVGLGGTGCDTLRTIKETFAERYILPKDTKGQELPAPIKTAYLGFDSLSERPEGLEVNEYVNITFSGLKKTLENQNELLYPHEKEWVNINLKAAGTGGGMQANRQAARLSLSRNFDTVNQAIKGAIQNIVSTTAGNPDARANHVEIVVVTGIGGGTGSGTFLDMCQILRAAARESTSLPATLTGYIVMPDVSLVNVAAATGMEDPIKRNAYAALKELDFWMRVKKHEVPYRMVYGNNSATIEWKEPPFDHCILMSSSNVEGIPYKDGYQAVRSTIAENLMHYMAKEDGTDIDYSYRQYENNLDQIDVVKTYPLYYGYRAIGAFTKRIPKKSILYYEGALLFKTFIPMRDDSGKLQPDHRMFTDGQGKVRAEEITGNGKQMLTDFRTNISKLPGFCSVDIKDKNKVASVQNMNPAPHNKWHTWRDTVCAPTALKASESYLKKAWERFEKFAESVIMDPEQGPFALEAYLDAQNGLISYMDEILASWENQYKKMRNQAIGQAEEQCNATWPTFRNPPVLGKAGALEQYVHAVATLYTYVNNCEFLEKHVECLKKLILRVKEYLRDGLKPMCAAILSLEEEFNKQQSQDDAVLVQDIYSLDTVRDSIDEAFKEANAEEKMSSRFLEKVAEIAAVTQPNVDAKTSGVEFICRSVGLQTMCREIESELKDVYGDVNNQSLDQIMIANVGKDLTAQQKWMDNLATSALDSALPMFMQDAVFKAASKAPYCYMSIPQNAPEHLKYISDAFKNHDPAVQPKASSLDDHIYVLTAWDKLPLFRYGMFEELRKAYDNDLNKDTAFGIHLVRNGNANADYRNDWTQLPSPKPYFLFARNSVINETMQYKKVHDLVERGIKCGMITVDDEQPHAKATINMLYANNVALLSSEAMRQKVKEIQEAKNPATGDAYSKSEIDAHLVEFLKTGKTIILEEKAVEPSNIASVLDLGQEPTNPFDPQIQGDLEKLKQAQKNHKLLCVVMTEALVYRRPDIVSALEMQLPAYEEISDIIDEGGVFRRTWEIRNAYAETAAELFMFLNDIIFLGGNGLKYKNKGQKYDIITDSLLAGDLKSCESDLVKTASFLADVPKDNGAKADLEKLLNVKRREFEDAIDGETLTKDEMDEILSAANDLIAELKDDQEKLEHEIHMNPARTDELQPQADMANAMRKVLEVRAKNYKKIAKGLD